MDRRGSRLPMEKRDHWTDLGSIGISKSDVFNLPSKAGSQHFAGQTWLSREQIREDTLQLEKLRRRQESQGSGERGGTADCRDRSQVQAAHRARRVPDCLSVTWKEPFPLFTLRPTPFWQGEGASRLIKAVPQILHTSVLDSPEISRARVCVVGGGAVLNAICTEKVYHHFWKW